MSGGDRGGVSTSGSLLVIFFGAFLALGTIYTVASNTTDDLSGAYSDELSTQSTIVETDLSVEATYHAVDGNLTVRADNDGSTDLTVGDTNVLVDGLFRSLSGFGVVTVDGRETDLWKPDTQLRVENSSAGADRVKVVTEHGVAATATVDVADITQSNPQTLDRTGNGTDSTIAFDIESSYDANVTLLNVSVDAVDGESPTTIHYANNASLSEVNVTLAPDHSTAAATADGEFAIGETIPHGGVTLGPDGTARYRIGEFRDSNGDPVAMPSTTVTVTITFEDPHGVERTFMFTEGGF
jgi:flagellar protein FlaF